jgi:hypothetical protein
MKLSHASFSNELVKQFPTLTSFGSSGKFAKDRTTPVKLVLKMQLGFIGISQFDCHGETLNRCPFWSAGCLQIEKLEAAAACSAVTWAEVFLVSASLSWVASPSVHSPEKWYHCDWLGC